MCSFTVFIYNLVDRYFKSKQYERKTKQQLKEKATYCDCRKTRYFESILLYGKMILYKSSIVTRKQKESKDKSQ